MPDLRLYVRNLQNGCLAWCPSVGRYFWLSQQIDASEITLSEAELAHIAQPTEVKLASPTRLCWSAINLCNLTCDYCLDTKGTPELDTYMKQQVLENVLASGVLAIDFSGGEPLIMHDIFLLLGIVREHGRGATVTTNGAVLARHVSCLAPLVDCVRISIDGSCPESHDQLRKRPGLFATILEGIELLHSYSVPVRVNTVVMEPNLGEIEDIVKLAKSVGAKEISLLQYLPIGEAARTFNYYCVETTAFLELGRKLRAKYEDKDFKVTLRDIDGSRGYLVLWADGRVYANQNMRARRITERQMLLGNLLEERLDVLWHRAFGSVTLNITAWSPLYEVAR